MRRAIGISLGLGLVAAFAGLAAAQQNAPAAKAALEPEQPLVLTEAIPLEGIKGRFDHFAIGGGRIFVSALGSNAVEAINTGARTLDHSITGVPDPQGVVYSPETKKLFVASGSAQKVYIYDGATYGLIGTVDFEGGADNLRYDAANKRVYVGCGDDEKTGAIGTIDAVTNKRLDETYKLGGEPESFQLEKSGPNIYVNVPDLKQIVVVNRETKQVTRWTLQGIESNFPMALDEADHRLFVGSARAGAPRRVRHNVRQDGGGAAGRAGHRRFVLRRWSQARLHARLGRLHLRLPNEGSRPLPASRQSSHRDWRSHRRILGQAGQGLRPVLPRRSRAGNKSRGGPHLRGAGLSVGFKVLMTGSDVSRHSLRAPTGGCRPLARHGERLPQDARNRLA